MNRRRIQGVVRRYRIPGTTSTGYRPVWDMGGAAENKKRSRLVGVNRPST